MMYLKADTAVEVPVGPAVAVGDGFTPVTSLSIAGADEAELLKYNANTAIVTATIAGSLAAISGADGYYTLDLSTTDTNTEGFMVLLINDDSLILPIRLEFQVVAANIYDSMFAVAGTDALDVNVAEISGDSTASTNLEADYDGTGYNKSNSTIGTASVLTGHTVQTANHTSNISDILTDTAVIGAYGAGLTALATAANLATVDTVVDSILADTGTDGVVVASISDGAIGAAAVADIFSTTAITESYGTDGSALTVAQALYLIVAHMGEHAITSTTKTLKQLDGSSTAATFTLDDATSPTSIYRAT